MKNNEKKCLLQQPSCFLLLRTSTWWIEVLYYRFRGQNQKCNGRDKKVGTNFLTGIFVLKRNSNQYIMKSLQVSSTTSAQNTCSTIKLSTTQPKFVFLSICFTHSMSKLSRPLHISCYFGKRTCLNTRSSLNLWRPRYIFSQ